MTDFGRSTLPYCSFLPVDGGSPRVGVGLGVQVLDLTACASLAVPDHAPLFAAGSLDVLLGAGPAVWREVRDGLVCWLDDPRHAADAERHLQPVADVRLVMPFTVADYVDFYASEHHAANVGRILRPGTEPLAPSWRHLPVGYHGRAGTVVVSGTPVVRPLGQRRSPAGGAELGPTTKLDLEAEVGFVVGTPTRLGERVPVAAFSEHVFGVCVVNDWSARDIQAWEYVPLGPFLGKSFATSVSPWVVPLAALERARVEPPPQHPEPLPYLSTGEPWGLDVRLTVTVEGTEVSRPPFATTYWTAAQMLAHLTVNGAALRTGDLFASGTVSGTQPDELGSLLELTWDGTRPLTLADGTTRGFLQDGDTVTIAAHAWADGAPLCPLGEVTGTVRPALDATPGG